MLILSQFLLVFCAMLILAQLLLVFCATLILSQFLLVLLCYVNTLTISASVTVLHLYSHNLSSVLCYVNTLIILPVFLAMLTLSQFLLMLCAMLTLSQFLLMFCAMLILSQFLRMFTEDISSLPYDFLLFFPSSNSTHSPDNAYRLPISLLENHVTKSMMAAPKPDLPS